MPLQKEQRLLLLEINQFNIRVRYPDYMFEFHRKCTPEFTKDYFSITADITKRIQRLIKLASQDLRLEAVYLFGSSAKGATHEWSDIDLAIISPDFSGDSFEDNKKLFPYILQVDTAIEVHSFRPADFSPKNPFVKEIIKSGIRVH